MSQNLLQQPSQNNVMLDNGILVVETQAKVIDDENKEMQR